MEFCSPPQDRYTLGLPPAWLCLHSPLCCGVIWGSPCLVPQSPCGVKSSRWAFLTYTSLSTALSGGMQSQAPSP